MLLEVFKGKRPKRSTSVKPTHPEQVQKLLEERRIVLMDDHEQVAELLTRCLDNHLVQIVLPDAFEPDYTLPCVNESLAKQLILACLDWPEINQLVAVNRRTRTAVITAQRVNYEPA
jgi:hypothetical protein